MKSKSLNYNTKKHFDDFSDHRFPEILIIEVSGVCNAKCKYCARTRYSNRYSGDYMSPDLFEKIIDHLFSVGVINVLSNNKIYLYNWGEAFLNPKINDILRILKKNNLQAAISSNFIKAPSIDLDCFSVISEILFSLPGFSQNTYEKIHSARFDSVLNNFNFFNLQLKKYNPDCFVKVNWHRYKFNEHELFLAYKYFRNLNVYFSLQIAFFNDLIVQKKYFDQQLSIEDVSAAQKDIFLDYYSKSLQKRNKYYNDWHCYLSQYLVIDEYANLTLCCGLSSKDEVAILGSVLKMTLDDINEKKNKAIFCQYCISSGLHKFSEIGNMALPSGDIMLYIALWSQLNIPVDIKAFVFNKAANIIKKLPNGVEYVRHIKNLLHK